MTSRQPTSAAGPSRHRLGRFVILVAAALVLGVGVLASAPAAEAKTPCWKRLINDWYDGRIDNGYPVKCYREAIKNLPEDVQTYSSARDDINRALLAAIRSGDGPLSPNTVIRPEEQPQEAEVGPPSDKPIPKSEGGPATNEPGRDKPDGPIGEVLDKIGPSNADSVPIPLLVLAGIALLLLAAAAAGFVNRRVQERRVRVAPPPAPPSEHQT